MTGRMIQTANAYDVRIECSVCHESKSGSLARAWASGHASAHGTECAICGYSFDALPTVEGMLCSLHRNLRDDIASDPQRAGRVSIWDRHA
jgi:hypothetical protein